MTQNSLPEIIRKILADRKPVEIEDRGRFYRRASVLIPVLKEGRKYKILFTKRTQLVDAHKGQISFPGGRIDENDSSPEMTALREAEEEIGLKREDVEVLGRTDDVITATSNFIVSPFVGLIPYPYDFRVAPFEVDRILIVPFSAFVPDGIADRIMPIEFEGNRLESLAYTHEGDVIWGATARIMKSFIEILGNSIDAFFH